MKSNEANTSKGPIKLSRCVNVMVVILNIFLLVCVFLLYSFNNKAYDKKLIKENIENIVNLNDSAIMNTTALFDSWKIKLEDIAKYVETHDLTHKQALALIDKSNSSDERYFELIGTDCKGNLAKKDKFGTYPALDYSSSSYAELHKIFKNAEASESGEIRFAPEYTDGGELATKFLAVYKYISLKDSDGQKKLYTLMLATSSKNVLNALNEHNVYTGQSTILTDSSGNYIVSNQSFKSSNFFQYLYVYNNLTLDQKNKIQHEMETNERGTLYYKNADAVVEDCVFCYKKTNNNDWYGITCVPLSSFHKTAFNINYIIYAVILLLIIFVIDVFWLQNMNRRLRISIQREKEASAAKGNFMSRMSHEIRTPLNAIIGYNIIARNELSNEHNDEEYKQTEVKVMDCLVKSDIASKHLLTIINDVLDMSAIESGKIKYTHEKFDFKRLITSLTAIFYSQAKIEGIEFEVVLESLIDEWFVGDPLSVNQILTNLLSNAVKFTLEGGKVKLIINQYETDVNTAHIHFEVIDTGIGMTQEYIGHIWTPFEQADSSISRRFGGTGLGLSITKNRVDIMGGTITVDSTIGVGTTFNVDLEFERINQPRKIDTYNFKKIKAIVIDDDINTSNYMKLLFNHCGAECDSFTSGKDGINAISIAYEKGEPYTLCIVDQEMPNVDGFETIKLMKKKLNNNIPVIVLSTYDYTEVAGKAEELGVDKFILKPVFKSSLLDLLLNAKDSKPAEKTETNSKIEFSKVRVLLAEDNVMNMEIAKKIMESTGLIVDSAWNGREAIDIFEKSAPGTYKVILMDIHMPEINGHEATRAIRASSHPDGKTIPIIAMTADAFAENVAESHEAGMNDHISKPIDVQALFNILKKYI